MNANKKRKTHNEKKSMDEKSGEATPAVRTAEYNSMALNLRESQVRILALEKELKTLHLQYNELDISNESVKLSYANQENAHKLKTAGLKDELKVAQLYIAELKVDRDQKVADLKTAQQQIAMYREEREKTRVAHQKELNYKRDRIDELNKKSDTMVKEVKDLKDNKIKLLKILDDTREESAKTKETNVKLLKLLDDTRKELAKSKDDAEKRCAAAAARVAIQFSENVALTKKLEYTTNERESSAYTVKTLKVKVEELEKTAAAFEDLNKWCKDFSAYTAVQSNSSRTQITTLSEQLQFMRTEYAAKNKRITELEALVVRVTPV